MTKRDFSATIEARRYVAHCVAQLVDPACGHLNEFIYDAADEFTIRCREKALVRLVAKLRKEAKGKTA